MEGKKILNKKKMREVEKYLIRWKGLWLKEIYGKEKKLRKIQRS